MTKRRRMPTMAQMLNAMQPKREPVSDWKHDPERVERARIKRERKQERSLRNAMRSGE